MLAKVDYVLSPSSYVTQSFLARNFKPQQILRNVYPVNLSLFHPFAGERPAHRPLTIINTGALSLRKGTPYLLEAYRLLLKRHPSVRLLLTNSIRDDVKPILRRYSDLPIDWSPPLAHSQLVERLQSADVYVMPSLEEGLVRTALEAIACGLQVVLTSHCGANDFVVPGVNGEVVPIRDAERLAEAILLCWERIQKGRATDNSNIIARFSFDRFAQDFLEQLRLIGLCAPS